MYSTRRNIPHQQLGDQRKSCSATFNTIVGGAAIKMKDACERANLREGRLVGSAGAVVNGQ